MTYPLELKTISKLEIEVDTLEIDKKVRNRVKFQMENSKGILLNEQLRAIQKELGNDEDGKDEFQEIKEKSVKLSLQKMHWIKLIQNSKNLKTWSNEC